jgi:hypothetical protein
MTRGNGDRQKERERWHLNRERIMMFAGLAIIFYESILAEKIGSEFHFEILLAGLALCGVSITQLGDRK